MQLIKETPLNAFFSMNWFIYMCRLCALWWLSLILVPTMTYCSISMSHVTKRDNTKRTYGHRSNKSHSTCICIEQIYQPGTIFIICIKMHKMLIHKIFMKNPLLIYWLSSVASTETCHDKTTTKLCQCVINWLCARLLHVAYMYDDTHYKNMFSH